MLPNGVLAVVSSRGHATSVPAVASMLAAALRHEPWQRVITVPAGPHTVLGYRADERSVETRGVVSDTESSVWVAFCGLLIADRSAATAEYSVAPDASRALAAYLARGSAMIADLDGEFALVVWDGRTQELIVASDRFGLYPHYYVLTDDAFAVAPEMAPLLRVPGVTARVDPVAVAEFARFQQLLDDHTWFRDIRLVPPGSVLRYDARRHHLSVERYWDWDRIPAHEPIHLHEAAGRLNERFAEAVRTRLRAGERAGVFLSGGLDSRFILAHLPQPELASTFTFGARNSRDVILGRRVASAAGCRDYWSALDDAKWILEHAPLHLALTEGQHAWHHMHGIAMRAEARAHADVNLTGWGGGSLLAGDLLSMELHGKPMRSPLLEDELVSRLYHAFCHRFTWPGLSDEEATALLGRCDGVPLDGLAFESLRTSITRTQHYPGDRRADYYYTAQHDRRSTINFVVFTRSALDVRCPYFDYELIDYVYSLSQNVRLDPRLRRVALTRRAAVLARIPHDRDWRLPHGNPFVRGAHALAWKIIGRLHRVAPLAPLPATLYFDYEEHLRTGLRSWAEELLLSERSTSRGLFAPDVVRALWERHVSGRELWTIGKVAPLMTLELVMRHIVEGEPFIARASTPAAC